jgi:hypothetical protein
MTTLTSLMMTAKHMRKRKIYHDFLRRLWMANKSPKQKKGDETMK